MTFKLATWNVNSVKARLEHLIEFLETHSPDILALQELKCETDKFPEESLAHLPYNFYAHGQKTYNGVAILSKIPADEIRTEFPDNPVPEHARFIEGTFNTPVGYIRFISLYAPNGGEVGSNKFEMKLEFYDAFTKYIQNNMSTEEHLLVGSDFNIAPFDIDVYNPKSLQNSTCFTLTERDKMRRLLNTGMEDCYRLLHQNTKEFSWWDYRGGSFEQNKGMRIDTIIANPSATKHLSKAYIDYKSREKTKPSDHAPVIVELESTD